MGNFLRKLARDTNRIVNTQIMNSPDFQAEASRVTGGKRIKRRFDTVEIKLRKGRGKGFKKHLEDTHPSVRGRVTLE